MFLTMRAAHVLLAAIWFGAVTANVFFVIPAIQEAKSAGGQVMGILTRRGYITFLQAVSGIVTLTGFYLYYHLTQGFNPIVSGSMPARVFLSMRSMKSTPFRWSASCWMQRANRPSHASWCATPRSSSSACT